MSYRIVALCAFLMGCAPTMTRATERSAVSAERAGSACEQQVQPGEPGILDCNGICVPTSWLGDGQCDDGSDQVDLTCGALDQDGGDCGSTEGPPPSPAEGSGTPSTPPATPSTPPATPSTPPATPSTPPSPAAVPGATCSAGSVAGIVDCGGQCVPQSWTTDDSCDDGSNGVDFMCAALSFDNGACDTGTGGTGTGTGTGSPTPAPTPPGTCTTTGGLPGVTACDGFTCIEAAWVGDGICDPELQCAQHSEDGGDCAGGAPGPAPAPGTCTTFDGLPGTTGCDGFTCVQADWVGDGICDPELQCPLHANDGGDC